MTGETRMSRYDPETTPNPTAWQALDELERIALVRRYHVGKRIRLPNVELHSQIHAAIENQVAGGMESVQRALVRLQDQGLTRHDAVHAVGSVLAEHLYDRLQAARSDEPAKANARYEEAVKKLTAESWYEKYAQDK